MNSVNYSSASNFIAGGGEELIFSFRSLTIGLDLIDNTQFESLVASQNGAISQLMPAYSIGCKWLALNNKGIPSFLVLVLVQTLLKELKLDFHDIHFLHSWHTQPKTTDRFWYVVWSRASRARGIRFWCVLMPNTKLLVDLRIEFVAVLSEEKALDLLGCPLTDINCALLRWCCVVASFRSL